jgi:salicylate hydroxylase
MAPSFDVDPVPNGGNFAAKTADSPIFSSKWKQFAHPTNSLLFMDHLDTEKNHQQKPPLQAAVKLTVIVIGGGLGGLACAIALARRGHTVTVLEAATKLGEVSVGRYISKLVQADKLKDRGRYSNSAELLATFALLGFGTFPLTSCCRTKWHVFSSMGQR